MGAELVRPMKPWMVMLMLRRMQVQQAGLDPKLGLDQHFFDRATAAEKAVVGLETAESQIDLFDSMPEALQEQLLRSTLDEIDAQSQEIATHRRRLAPRRRRAIERDVLRGFQEVSGRLSVR